MTMPSDEVERPDHNQSAQVRDTDMRTGKAAAAARIHYQATWVDEQIRVAMERGEFDNLPGAGKPIEDLGVEHDSDWWLKRLVERERIVVLPLSLQLRREDAELDARLDTFNYEDGVRAELADFNERVIKARYALAPGPPLVTMPRDVEETLAAWAVRRQTRRDAAAAAREAHRKPPRRRWWRLAVSPTSSDLLGGLGERSVISPRPDPLVTSEACRLPPRAPKTSSAPSPSGRPPR